MGPEWWFNLAREGGMYLAPCFLGGLIWMAADRKRLVDEVKEKDDKLYALSIQIATLSAELKAIVFGKAA